MTKPISFAIGTGRCGTLCLSELVGLHQDMESFHEINPLNETFHRFCKWYDLPVDNAGFLHHKRAEIEQSHGSKLGFFEASAYLSLSIQDLYDAFDCKFILMVRHPAKVINSYIRKGWYKTPLIVDDPTKIPGHQPTNQFHHYLGRTVPKDMDYTVWNEMPLVGKLAWYWSTVNAAILEQLKKLPPENYHIQRLEGLDYRRYQQIAEFIGTHHPISNEQFLTVTSGRPNAFDNLPTEANWTHNDRRHFMRFTSELAETFGYDLAEFATS